MADLSRRTLLAGATAVVGAPSIVRAQGQNGVALVIGNSKYLWEAALPNVKRDAPDVAKRFQALGLRTELVMDADRKTMLAAIGKLKAGALGASFAAVYFAGHGVSWEKADYLVPVDADLSNPASLKALIHTRDFYESVNPAAHRMVVLDNCRNNPSDGWRQTEAERRAFGGRTSLAERDSEYLLLAPPHQGTSRSTGRPARTALLRHAFCASSISRQIGRAHV